MEETSFPSLNELQQSLGVVRQLRRSGWISVFLMIIGVAVIVGSFIYSLAKLRPLERQVNEKQKQLQNAETELSRLVDESNEIRQANRTVQVQLEMARTEINIALAKLQDVRKTPLPAKAKIAIDDAISKISGATDTVNKGEGELLKSDAAALHNRRGFKLSQEGDQQGEEQEYRAALRIDPNYARAHNNLGTVLRDKGDKAGAELEFRTAISLDPKDYLPRNNLGKLLSEEGDFDGAERELNKALKLNPAFPYSHYNLGIALEKKGDSCGAFEHIKRAHELDPDNQKFEGDWERLKAKVKCP